MIILLQLLLEVNAMGDIYDLGIGEEPLQGSWDFNTDKQKRTFYVISPDKDYTLLSIQAVSDVPLVMYVRQTDLPYESEYDNKAEKKNPYTVMIPEVTAGSRHYIYVKGHCDEVMLSVKEEEVSPLAVSNEKYIQIVPNTNQIYELSIAQDIDMLKIALEPSVEIFVNPAVPTMETSMPVETVDGESYLYLSNLKSGDTYFVLLQAEIEQTVQLRTVKLDVSDVVEDLDDGVQIDVIGDEVYKFYTMYNEDDQLYLRIITEDEESEIQAYLGKGNVPSQYNYWETTEKSNSITFNLDSVDTGDYYIVIYNTEGANFSILFDSYEADIIFIENDSTTTLELDQDTMRFLVLEVPPETNLEMQIMTEVMSGVVDVFVQLCSDNLDYCTFWDGEFAYLMDSDIAFERQISTSRTIVIKSDLYECTYPPCWVSVWARSRTEQAAVEVTLHSYEQIQTDVSIGQIARYSEKLIRHEVTDLFLQYLEFIIYTPEDEEQGAVEMCVKHRQFGKDCIEQPMIKGFGELMGVYYIKIQTHETKRKFTDFELKVETEDAAPAKSFSSEQIHYDRIVLPEISKSYPIEIYGSDEIMYPIKVVLTPRNDIFEICLSPPDSSAKPWCTDELDENSEFTLIVSTSHPKYVPHGTYNLTVTAIEFAEDIQADFSLQYFADDTIVVMEDDTEYEIEGLTSFEFVVEAGNDVWIEIKGDYEETDVWYIDINERPKELKNLRKVNDKFYIPNELIIAPSHPPTILVDVDCEECRVQSYDELREVREFSEANVPKIHENTSEIQFFSGYVYSQDVVVIDAQVDEVQVFLSRDENIVVTAREPTLTCAHDICEILKSRTQEIISIAVIGSGYTIERQYTPSTTSEPSEDTSEPTAPTQEPSEDTSDPTATASEPSEDTSGPTTPTQEPSEDTSRPTTPTSEPSEDTSVPTPTTSGPQAPNVGPPIVEKVETIPNSSDTWLNDFIEDYGFYLVIGGGVLGLLIIVLITVAICKRCGRKSGGYGELGPDESVIEDEDEISEIKEA